MLLTRAAVSFDHFEPTEFYKLEQSLQYRVWPNGSSLTLDTKYFDDECNQHVEWKDAFRDQLRLRHPANPAILLPGFNPESAALISAQDRQSYQQDLKKIRRSLVISNVLMSLKSLMLQYSLSPLTPRGTPLPVAVTGIVHGMSMFNWYQLFTRDYNQTFASYCDEGGQVLCLAVCGPTTILCDMLLGLYPLKCNICHEGAVLGATLLTIGTTVHWMNIEERFRLLKDEVRKKYNIKRD